MESLLLNIISNISDNWIWLGPLLLLCIVVIAGAKALKATGIDFRRHKDA